MGIPLIVDGYGCDDYDGRCLCPYDTSDNPGYQTFITFEDYKKHMEQVHQKPPIQKRKVRKPCSNYVVKARSTNAIKQHLKGSFLNTHVKKETLLEFIDLYDEFFRDLLNHVRGGKEFFKEHYEKYFSITGRDLEMFSLDALIRDIKDNRKTYITRSGMLQAQYAENENEFGANLEYY